MNTYRLFTAVDLPEEVKGSVCRICSGIPGVKWIDASQLHLTLRFIGDADTSLFERIREGLAGVRVQPFELSLRGVGRFPPKRDPRVLWVGVEMNELLVQLQHLVEQTLVTCGLVPEERHFSPHITLARLKDVPLSPVAAFLERNRLFSTPPFPVTEFYLYSSTLTSHGAIHRREATYPLKG
ncbi:RNA 2',3'-cyclic phosphodiesterase [bacterium]|nr:RNA 2',3'-cyclic phosphodiesterase [bacterium]